MLEVVYRDSLSDKLVNSTLNNCWDVCDETDRFRFPLLSRTSGIEACLLLGVRSSFLVYRLHHGEYEDLYVGRRYNKLRRSKNDYGWLIVGRGHRFLFLKYGSLVTSPGA